MNTLDALDAESLRTDVPDFRPGDTLKVHVRVVEGSRERIQVFQGVVIRRQGSGVRETFTVRKVSFGEALLPPRPARQGCQDQGEARPDRALTPGTHLHLVGLPGVRRDPGGKPRPARRT